jgi:hypothetical protein
MFLSCAGNFPVSKFIYKLAKIEKNKNKNKTKVEIGINMSKNENPSEQNDILVVVKVTLTCRAIYSLLYGVRFLTALKTVMRSLDVLF